MDDQYKLVTRKVFNLVDAAKSTGGFMTVIVVIASLMIQRFQKMIYYTSMVKSLF